MMESPAGQLLPAERAFLHDAVVKHRPSLVLEVGTWFGGGSTLQIADAIVPEAMFFTCDPNYDCYLTARKFYQNRPQVRVVHCSGADMITFLRIDKKFPDFVFFDGAEDPSMTFNEFKMLEEITRVGCVFICHDWDPPSKKAETLRPYLQGSSRWMPLGFITAPVSVGMCKYIRT